MSSVIVPVALRNGATILRVQSGERTRLCAHSNACVDQQDDSRDPAQSVAVIRSLLFHRHGRRCAWNCPLLARHGLKNCPPRLRPGPNRYRGNDFQGVSVLPTRKPTRDDSVVGKVRDAISRAEVLRIARPGTAANDASIANSTGPRGTVCGYSLVVIVAILHPLGDVAGHVVDAERIGGERADRSRLPKLKFLLIRSKFL